MFRFCSGLNFSGILSLLLKYLPCNAIYHIHIQYNNNYYYFTSLCALLNPTIRKPSVIVMHSDVLFNTGHLFFYAIVILPMYSAEKRAAAAARKKLILDPFSDHLVFVQVFRVSCCLINNNNYYCFMVSMGSLSYGCMQEMTAEHDRLASQVLSNFPSASITQWMDANHEPIIICFTQLALFHQILASPNPLKAYRHVFQWLHCLISMHP